MDSVNLPILFLSWLPILYFSIFAHEFGHAAMGYSVGLTVNSFGVGIGRPWSVVGWARTRIFFCRTHLFQGITFRKVSADRLRSNVTLESTKPWPAFTRKRRIGYERNQPIGKPSQPSPRLSTPGPTLQTKAVFCSDNRHSSTRPATVFRR